MEVWNRVTDYNLSREPCVTDDLLHRRGQLGSNGPRRPAGSGGAESCILRQHSDSGGNGTTRFCCLGYTAIVSKSYQYKDT